MAKPSDVHIEPPTEPTHPVCEICGWHDRKLRNVALHVTPEERILIHKWARHNHTLPSSWSKDFGKLDET